MRAELQTVLASLPDIAPEELPRLLGELEEIRATALMRLTAPAQEKAADRRLNIEEAAARLGVSTEYLYKNHYKFPFTRREGRKLLFSSAGIDKHLRQK